MGLTIIGGWLGLSHGIGSFANPWTSLCPVWPNPERWNLWESFLAPWKETLGGNMLLLGPDIVLSLPNDPLGHERHAWWHCQDVESSDKQKDTEFFLIWFSCQSNPETIWSMTLFHEKMNFPHCLASVLQWVPIGGAVEPICLGFRPSWSVWSAENLKAVIKPMKIHLLFIITMHQQF